MLTRKDLIQVLDLGYEHGKKLIALWHECKMQQIRLDSANRKHLEDTKHQLRIDQIKYQSKRNNGYYQKRRLDENDSKEPF